MDANELKIVKIDKVLSLLSYNLRRSKAEIMDRFDRQDVVLESLDLRVKEANGKTGTHAGMLAEHKSMIIELQQAIVRNSPKHDKFTCVLIEWGKQLWFPWVICFLIATAGGNSIFLWGKALIALFTPKP